MEKYLLDEDDPDDDIMIKFFEPIKIIGKGAFSTVIEAIERISKKQVAIKIIEKKVFKQSALEMLRREAQILKMMNHPNIIKMKMSKETESKLFIVMDLVQGQPLTNFLKDLQPEQIKTIAIQLVQAIAYYQELNIIHRDLKPDNIMLTSKDLKVKIIDFGLAGEQKDYNPLRDNCGTLLYMAPEVALKKVYNRSVDIWSLGIIVFVMFSKGQHPFWNDDDSREIYSERLKNPTFTFWPEDIDKVQMSFITNTAARRSDCRLSAKQCLNHAWLQGKNQVEEIITMGKMIQAFNNSQKLFQIIKAMMFIKNILNRMSDSNGVQTVKLNYSNQQQFDDDDSNKEIQFGSYKQNFSSQESLEKEGEFSRHMRFRRSFENLSNEKVDNQEIPALRNSYHSRSSKNFKQKQFEFLDEKQKARHFNLPSIKQNNSKPPKYEFNSATNSPKNQMTIIPKPRLSQFNKKVQNSRGNSTSSYKSLDK